MNKILILSDGQGWIVDRITDRMVEGMPQFKFTKEYYTRLDPQEFYNKAMEHDLIHYQNSDITWQRNVVYEIAKKKPFLLSIRSFRFPKEAYIFSNACNVHVVGKDLLEYFPKAKYIPDAVDDKFNRKLRVGMAIGSYSGNLKYKGYDLVSEACRDLGVEFKPAVDISYDEMTNYYDSIDVYVCASENEGTAVPILECLALNKPVISTNVGVAKELPVMKIERDVESIKSALKAIMGNNLVFPRYSWNTVNSQFAKLYETLINEA